MCNKMVSLLTLACVLVAAQGMYTDKTEDDILYETESKCPSDEWYASGLSCYYHLSGGLDFFEANRACIALDKRAHLADFRDQSQYYHIHHILAHENQHHEHPTSGTWIGLMKDGEQWTWTDGTPLAYNDFWLPSAMFTDGNCGYIPSRRVGYAVGSCDHKKAALCELIPEEYTMIEQQRRTRDIVIVSIVIALVLVGGIAVLVTGIAKYCCNRSPRDKGYKLHKDQEVFMPTVYPVKNDQI
ncbi:uncharacterized protein [Ptychodera flava]|uniref:uncharacterized protein n=1 Tax=Ptychodera flava TaxID=63121 RepID=UPI00396A25C5